MKGGRRGRHSIDARGDAPPREWVVRRRRGSPRPTVRVHHGDVEAARDRLCSARAEAMARLTSLTGDHDAVIAASRDTNADDEHDPEGATIAFERSQIAALVQQARRHLEEIDAAEGRLDAGTYGSCESCGSDIAESRLEVRPAARTCIACASAR